MADKSIFELNLQTTFATNDRLVVGNYANSDAEAITGQTLVNLLATMLDGHGGIQSIAKTGSSGTDPVVDVYTITLADQTTTTFSVTNGLKGDTGDQTFVYFRWAHTQPSSWSDTTDQPDEWMGVYAGTATTPPTTVSAYAWVKVRGDKGDTGDASTITTQNVSYQESSSGTVAPSGSWTTTIPTVTPGNFLWTRTQLAFNDGTTVTAYSVSRYGIDGSGAVSSVNNVSPDSNGNVALTGTDIPLSDNQSIQTHVTDAEDDIDALKTNLSTVKSDLGIVEDTDTATHAIAAGQYVIWKDALYVASTAISLGTTLSASNLTAVSNGGFNALMPEYGSTVNGAYIKFPDGTLIQWGVNTLTASNNRAWGNLYVADFTNITFPVSFISTPSFNITPSSASSVTICSCTPSETGVTGIQGTRGTAFGSAYTFSWQAIGRWK